MEDQMSFDEKCLYEMALLGKTASAVSVNLINRELLFVDYFKGLPFQGELIEKENWLIALISNLSGRKLSFDSLMEKYKKSNLNSNYLNNKNMCGLADIDMPPSAYVRGYYESIEDIKCFSDFIYPYFLNLKDLLTNIQTEIIEKYDGFVAWPQFIKIFSLFSEPYQIQLHQLEVALRKCKTSLVARSRTSID